MGKDNRDSEEKRIDPIFSKKLLLKMADVVPSILYIIDITKINTIYVNQKVKQYLGYTPEEIKALGKKFVIETIHPQDHQPFIQHIEKLKKSTQGEVLVFEYQIKTAEGDWRWFQSRDTAYEFDSRGAVSFIIGTAIDITERKETERKLKENQEQLFQAQSIAKLGYYTFNPLTGQISISKMLSQISGIDEGNNLDYSQWLNSIHADSRDKFTALYNEAINQKLTSYEMEYKTVCQKTGEQKWVRGIGKIIYNEKDEAAEMFGTVLDITQQIEIREKLKQSNEKLDNIIRHSSSLFYSHTPEGYITYLSPQSRELLDCDNETAKSYWQEFVTDNSINEHGIKLTAEAIKTRKKQPQYIMELKTKTGRIIWVLVDESPVVENNRTVAMVGSLTDITKRKQLEEELKQSNEQYKALNKELSESLEKISIINSELENAKKEISTQRELLNNIIENLPVGLQVFNTKGTSLMVNKKQKEILGLPNLNEGVNKFNVLTDPYSKVSGIDKGFKQALKGKTIKQELNIDFGLEENKWDTRKDKRILSETIFPVYDIYNNVSHAISLLEDVTEKRRIEDRLKLVIESSPIGIVLYTPQGELLFYNKRFTELFGYAQDEISSKEQWDIKSYPNEEYRKKVLQKWEQHVNEYFEGKSFRSFEAEVRCKDGSIKNIEFGFGAIEELHITTFVDITERNKILKEVERNKALLNENEKISRTGAWEYDADKKEIFWTDGLRRLFELNKNQVKLEIGESIKCYKKEDRIKIIKAVENCVTKGVNYDLINSFTTLKGNQKWMRTIITKPNATYSKKNSVIGSLMDITEQVNSEIKLKELNATKDKLFSIVSHDLRNPMGAIINLAELALWNIDDTNKENLEKYLDIITQSGRRSVDLLNNLFEWSTLNTGRISVNPKSLKLYPCIEEISELFKSQIFSKDITFNNSIPKQFAILADEKLINTVLRNLISNAIKYTPKNGTIELKAKQTENGDIISISDTGVGINKADMEKIFDSNTFFSKQGTNNEQGSGLGLMLCHEFVKMHNGEIKLKSKPGKGSTFHIILPHQE